MESEAAALALASGYPAQLLVFKMLMDPGALIVAAKKLYGGVLNQLAHSVKNFDGNVGLVDSDNLDQVQAAITNDTRCVFIDSLANPRGTRPLFIHPASTTHSQLSEAELVEAGAGPDVVRVSVGIEHIDDIIGDMEQALRLV